MVIFMNLCNTIGIFGLEDYTLGTWFNHFSTYSTTIISHKKEIEIWARFWSIFDFELNEKGHEPSQTENPSAIAWASLAGTHTTVLINDLIIQSKSNYAVSSNFCQSW